MRWKPIVGLLRKGVIWSDLCFKRTLLVAVPKTGHNYKGRIRETRWETISIIQVRGGGDLAQGGKHWMCEDERQQSKVTQRLLVRAFYVTRKKKARAVWEGRWWEAYSAYPDMFSLSPLSTISAEKEKRQLGIGRGRGPGWRYKYRIC